MENICFIPARDSSTRLKKKALAEYCGGNLITHTIEQAINSDLFNRIILSSNSDLILSIGKDFEIETHLRDDSRNKIIDVMQEAIPELDILDTDIIGLLLVTCPLRSIDDIIGAYITFINSDKENSVVSVSKNENPIQLSFKLDNDLLVPVMPDEYYQSTSKQDHYDTFHYNDAIIFDTCKNFMKPDRNLFGDNPLPYIMPWERSIAIDYKFQLDLTRLLAEVK